MFEAITKFFKRIGKKEQEEVSSKDTAKERLHLVLMQDRANMSADFLDMMKQEIIDVIKKYIDVDEKEIDVKLTNKTNEDGTVGAPALYANIPIMKIKQELLENKTKNDEKTVISKEEPVNVEEKANNNEEIPKENVEIEKEEEQENKEEEKNNLQEPQKEEITEEPTSEAESENNTEKQ